VQSYLDQAGVGHQSATGQVSTTQVCSVRVLCDCLTASCSFGSHPMVAVQRCHCLLLLYEK
jgi:hypothetical protein